MLGPHSISANKLGEETGVCQSTLSRWSREAPDEVKKRGNGLPRSSDSNESRPVRPDDLPPAEKFRLLREAAELSEEDLGAFLRRNGIHHAQLDEWRQKALEALQKPKGARKRSIDTKRIRELERELRRKDKALAEVTALLVLKKNSSLEALARAAAVRPSKELRDEAIACMGLLDLRPVQSWKLTDGSRFFAFDALGERYALVGKGGEVSVRRADGHGEILRIPNEKGDVWVFGFSPDGSLLPVHWQSGERPPLRSHLRLYSVPQGEAVLEISAGVAGGGTPAKFSPDARWLALGQRDGTLRLFDIASRSEFKRYSLGHGEIQDVNIHPGLERAAVSFRFQPEIVVLDLVTGKSLVELRHPARANDVAWHRDGRLLAVACHDQNVYLWDPTRAAEPLAVLKGHEGQVIGIGWLPRGDFLVSSSWDNTSRFWKVGSERPVLTVAGEVTRNGIPRGRRIAAPHWNSANTFDLEEPGEYTSLDPLLEPTTSRGFCLSADGALAACGSDEGLRLWDLKAGKAVAFLPLGYVRSVFFTPPLDRMITAGKSGVLIWSIATAAQMTACSPKVVVGPSKAISRNAPDAYAFLAADGNTLAWVSEGAVHIERLDSSEKRAVFKITPGHRECVLTPDGRWLATFGWKQENVDIWDVSTKAMVHRVPGFSPRAAASPDRKWIVTSTATELQLWATGTWEPGLTIPRLLDAGQGTDTAFSGDSRLFAFQDRRAFVRVFAVDTGEEVASLESPQRRTIYKLAFSQSGNVLATTRLESHALQFWDLGKVRQRLSAMGLDWDLPPYPQPPSPPAATKTSSTSEGPRLLEKVPLLNPLFLGESGSLEDGAQGTAPDFWQATGGKAELQVDLVPLAANEVSAGSPAANAVRLRGKALGKAHAFGSGAALFPLTPGRDYRVRFWARSGRADGTDQGFSVRFLLSGGPPEAPGKVLSRQPGSMMALTATRDWRLFTGPTFNDAVANSGGLAWSLSPSGSEGELLIALPEVEEMISPSDFVAEAKEGRVELRWKNHARYESLRILHDGHDVARLEARAAFYLDWPTSSLDQTYEVEAVLLGVRRRAGGNIGERR
jgi:WD40 repeat protein